MLAIIPARGGSKGVPGKNIKFLLGKPLIAYTIEAAKKSINIDRIVISTDNVEIANIAIRHGAECPFMRPSHLATDEALAIDNYIYTINRLNNEWGVNINSFIVLQPTSPLRTSDDIDNAIELFQKKNADSVISYTEEDHPIYWHKKINDDLTFSNIFADTLQNRQEYEKTYYPNGAIFVFRYKLIKERRYYSENSFAYIMPKLRSVDIDAIEDFLWAEFLLKKKIVEL